MIKNKYNKKLVAFTMAELMIVLTIISLISIASIKIYKSKVNYARSQMYYTTFMTLKQAFGELVAEGCTTTDVVTNGYCASLKSLPKFGHTADSRGLCDRLIEKVNTLSNNCSISTTVNGSSNFSTATPNLTLSNGIKIYNLGTTGLSTIYYVYTDVDGLKGSSKYGVDVVSFNLYTDGMLLPEGFMGYSTDYLSANVFSLNSGTENEVLHGVSYAKALCSSLTDAQKAASTVADISYYCSSYPTNNGCTTNGCRFEIIKPGYY